MSGHPRLGFGGGCHWCTEAVFQALTGVIEPLQGFIRSDPPNDSYSEAIELGFDPEQVSLAALIRVHLATHASASAHKMRGKYRSAIYVQEGPTCAPIRSEARQALEQARAETGIAFVTQVLAHRGFKPSQARFRNYHATDPARPFCRAYIDPKLARLRRDFSTLLRSQEDTP